MASCSLGVPKIKISEVEVRRVRFGSLLIPYNQRSLLGQRPVKYLSLRTFFGSVKAVQVGFFRRSKTLKGKRTPSSCKEKDHVKEGQVLCYIEQLGGQFPIESYVTGEVVKILREDGEPVGYSDALISILPWNQGASLRPNSSWS